MSVINQFPPLDKFIHITGDVYLSARSVTVQSDQMQVCIGIDGGLGVGVNSYLTVAQAREMAANLLEVAAHYEAVRQEQAA